MTMNVEALQTIELDATRAPAQMVDHYIQLVRNSLADCTADPAEYAAALLLKLDHLASSQRVHAIDSSQTQTYLAPWLALPAQSLLDAATEKGEAPLLVVCDEISDPHNLGAILRTAECAGAHGLIIPKRRSAGLTAIVGKTSAGAVSYLPVARVANLTSVLKDLKKQGVWIFGTAAGASTDLYSADLKGPAAIVIGSEGDGMSRLVAENCDFLVSIPMKGHISSLNASAAAAILLYEAVRQRRG